MVILINWVLLLPVLLESIAVIGILLVSSVKGKIIIGIANGAYVGEDDIISECISENPIQRLWFSFIGLFLLPLKLVGGNCYCHSCAFSCSCICKCCVIPNCRKVRFFCSSCERWGDCCSLFRSILWLLWYTMILLPDLVLSCMLFPVSYFVLLQRNSLESLIVGLAAVQFFARIDDLFVNKLFYPRRSTAGILQNYADPHPRAVNARYRPFRQYEATKNHFDFGLAPDPIESTGMCQSCCSFSFDEMKDKLSSCCTEEEKRKESRLFFRNFEKEAAPEAMVMLAKDI
eukprot:snap_masked-scaffold_64-processed-gene-0.27-mRNA-1 protein AED:1.00 eAED:1.00 QI:0/-1/0/0/-1/1/1/0/287